MFSILRSPVKFLVHRKYSNDTTDMLRITQHDSRREGASVHRRWSWGIRSGLDDREEGIRVILSQQPLWLPDIERSGRQGKDVKRFLKHFKLLDSLVKHKNGGM